MAPRPLWETPVLLITLKPIFSLVVRVLWGTYKIKIVADDSAGASSAETEFDIVIVHQTISGDETGSVTEVVLLAMITRENSRPPVVRSRLHPKKALIARA